MKVTIEIIGAVAMTIIILGTPVLSFISFIYDWHGFLETNLIILSAVDFLYVLSKLLGEIE